MGGQTYNLHENIKIQNVDMLKRWSKTQKLHHINTKIIIYYTIMQNTVMLVYQTSTPNKWCFKAG